MPGELLAGRYRVLSVLGRGGMGVVYLGEHIVLRRKVAIKLITPRWTRDADITRRFRAEARLASAAGHPNIVEVFDAGETPDGSLFIVMEYLSGATLREHVARNGPLSETDACHVVADVAKAIRAAHHVGVVHRDLKLANIMLADQAGSRVVKVLDFGLAAEMEPDASQSARLTRPGRPIGTPMYMAPEQFKGVRAQHGADVYAIGTVLYALLAGRPPFGGVSCDVLSNVKQRRAAPSLYTIRKDLSIELVSLVADCLEIDPTQRPATMTDVLTRLHEVPVSWDRAHTFLGGSARAATTPSPAERGQLPGTSAPRHAAATTGVRRVSDAIREDADTRPLPVADSRAAPPLPAPARERDAPLTRASASVCERWVVAPLEPGSVPRSRASVVVHDDGDAGARADADTPRREPETLLHPRAAALLDRDVVSPSEPETLPRSGASVLLGPSPRSALLGPGASASPPRDDRDLRSHVSAGLARGAAPCSGTPAPEPETLLRPRVVRDDVARASAAFGARARPDRSQQEPETILRRLPNRATQLDDRADDPYAEPETILRAGASAATDARVLVRATRDDDETLIGTRVDEARTLLFTPPPAVSRAFVSRLSASFTWVITSAAMFAIGAALILTTLRSSARDVEPNDARGVPSAALDRSGEPACPSPAAATEACDGEADPARGSSTPPSSLRHAP